MVIIGWLDAATGPAFGFSLFYLVPIVFAGWSMGRLPAATVALAAACAWLIADLTWQRTGMGGVSAWNAFTRLGIFLSMGILTARVRSDQARTQELLEEAKRLARTDALTGLANSRSFFESMSRRPGGASGADRFSLVYVDVDNFKRINDEEGHDVGDEVLRAIAECIAQPADGGDVVARLGGDEFALVLFDRQPEQVEGIVQRLIAETEALGRLHPGSDLSLSVGTVHVIPPGRADVSDILRRADNAMYEAKIARKAAAARLQAPGLQKDSRVGRASPHP